MTSKAPRTTLRILEVQAFHDDLIYGNREVLPHFGDLIATPIDVMTLFVERMQAQMERAGVPTGKMEWEVVTMPDWDS